MFKGKIKMKKTYKYLGFHFIGFFLFTNIVIGQDFFFGNNKPIAEAGNDIKTLSGEMIFLDGSRSFVGDGSKIKYHWIFSPGLVLKNDNDLSSEISIETYGGEYVKSVQTSKQVLKVKVHNNDPGTKLEVVLKIKDRIGFEDKDTLLVEYISPKTQKKSTPEMSMSPLLISSDVSFDSVGDKTNLDGIFIQGFSNKGIRNIDAQIINSIIMDQIKSIGFQFNVLLDTDIQGKQKPEGYKDECNSDLCIAKNAIALNTRYFLAWNFAQSADNLSLRVFESIDQETLIKEVNIIGPYVQMNQSGVYGLDKELRSSVSKLMGTSNFKKEISFVDRLIMKNGSLISYGKYPLVLGAAYLFIDKVFAADESDSDPKMPPGFPHDN
tara:strand:+ start:8731 stop:9870 length:1140 start_codon:yes stop_codon:yes gene_type:complete